jgi:hypothetical protein
VRKPPSPIMITALTPCSAEMTGIPV